VSRLQEVVLTVIAAVVVAAAIGFGVLRLYTKS
jgi:hypothetical protein